MTVGRQLSYHCPSSVATLKQVELFVWQLGCRREEEECFTFRREDGICRKCCAHTISQTYKVSKPNMKGDFDSRNLAGIMSGEEMESPCSRRGRCWDVC